MSKTPPTPGDGPSADGPFNDAAPMPPVELGPAFRKSHRVPDVEADFDQASEPEDPAKHLSKPTPTLTPEGVRDLVKKQPSQAMDNINPNKIPQTIPDKALPRRENFQKKAVGRHAAQTRQQGPQQDGNGREQ